MCGCQCVAKHMEGWIKDLYYDLQPDLAKSF
jgi:hypothetical protein